MDVQVGSTLTNGFSAARVVRRVEKGGRGWTVAYIALDPMESGRTGIEVFIPDYLLASWRRVPFEWAPVVGFPLVEERFVWAPSWRWLQRDIRPAVKSEQTPGTSGDE